MEWLRWVVTIGLGVTLGLIVSSRKPVKKEKIHIVNAEDFKSNMRKGQLVDIRKKEAFEQDRIKGARNFRKSQITSKFSVLRKDQAVFLYCQNGKASLRLAKQMSKGDFIAIYVLEHGFDSVVK